MGIGARGVPWNIFLSRMAPSSEVMEASSNVHNLKNES